MWTWLNANSGALNVLSTIALVGVTSVYVYLTWRLVHENQELRKATIRPDVAVSIALHEAHIHLINLVIENVGQGPAYDLTFTLDQSLNIYGGRSLDEVGPFKSGIRLLPPRQSVTMFLGNSTEMRTATSEPVQIKALWKDGYGTAYERTFVINFAEYENLMRVGSPPLHRMADSIDKIQQEVGHLTSGFRKLHVVASSPEELQAIDDASFLLVRMMQLPESERDEVRRVIDQRSAATERRSPTNGQVSDSFSASLPRDQPPEK